MSHVAVLESPDGVEECGSLGARFVWEDVCDQFKESIMTADSHPNSPNMLIIAIATMVGWPQVDKE